MTTMTVMPRDHAEWTVDDLDGLPDDGLRYELLDGILLVSPAPSKRHQRAVKLVFESRDGRYGVVGEAAGDTPLTLALPFPVTIVPSDLVRWHAPARPTAIRAWSSARRR
jgi:hypothetical protein